MRRRLPGTSINEVENRTSNEVNLMHEKASQRRGILGVLILPTIFITSGCGGFLE